MAPNTPVHDDDFPFIEPISEGIDDVFGGNGAGQQMLADDDDDDDDDVLGLEPLSPPLLENLESWTQALLDEDKTLVGLNCDAENVIVLNPEAKPTGPTAARQSNRSKATKRRATAMETSSSSDDERPAKQPRRKPVAVAAAPGLQSQLKEKLKDPNLTPEQISALRKEARMERNRASAERTRQRRLLHTALLEEKAQAQAALLARAVECLRGIRSGLGNDAELADQVLADYLSMLSNSSGPAMGTLLYIAVSLPSRIRRSRKEWSVCALVVGETCVALKAVQCVRCQPCPVIGGRAPHVFKKKIKTRDFYICTNAAGPPRAMAQPALH